MIKRISIFIVIILVIVTISGCSQNAIFNGVEYKTHGLINKSEIRNPNIRYKIVWGNVFLGIIFAETIIIPIYIFGYDLYEPIGVKN